MEITADGDAIHEGEQRLLEVNVQQRLGTGDLEGLAVLKKPVEALLAKLEKRIAKLGRVFRRVDREKRVPSRSGRLRLHHTGHLIHRVADDPYAAVRTVGVADSSPEQPQVIVQFRAGG